MPKLLDIQGLRVHFDTLDGPVEALHSVSLSVNEGEIMGVVGESGCGKSVTSLVTIGLATCDVDDGSITFDGDELIQKTPQRTQRILSFLKYFSSIFTLGLILSLFWTFLEPIQGLQISAVMLIAFSTCFALTRILDAPRSKHERFMRSIRGNKISMIFQEPMTALNPLYTVEKQVAEVLKQHNRLEEADTNSAMKIGKAIISPAEMSVHFFRNDWRGALPLITTFVFILVVHQTNNSDLMFGLLANKYSLSVIGVAFFWLVFSSLFFERNMDARELLSQGIIRGEEVPNLAVRIGFIGWGLGAILLLLGQKLSDPVTPTICAAMMPIFGAIVEVIFDNRKMKLNLIIGICLAIFGGYLATGVNLSEGTFNLGTIICLISVMLFAPQMKFFSLAAASSALKHCKNIVTKIDIISDPYRLL